MPKEIAVSAWKVSSVRKNVDICMHYCDWCKCTHSNYIRSVLCGSPRSEIHLHCDLHSGIHRGTVASNGNVVFGPAQCNAVSHTHTYTQWHVSMKFDRIQVDVNSLALHCIMFVLCLPDCCVRVLLAVRLTICNCWSTRMWSRLCLPRRVMRIRGKKSWW